MQSLLDLDIVEERTVETGHTGIGQWSRQLPAAPMASGAITANKSALDGLFPQKVNAPTVELTGGVTTTKLRSCTAFVLPGNYKGSIGPGAAIAASARALQAHCALKPVPVLAESQIEDSTFTTNVSRQYTPMEDYGRSRGGGGRKRRYREDDDADRRQQYASYPQKRRYEESVSTRVRKQIFTIADSPLRNPQEDVVAISKNLVDNYEDEYFRTHIADVSLQLVVEQPFKIPFIAAIVLYTNEKSPDYVRLILNKSQARLQEAVSLGQWRTFKLILRFLASMQTLFEGEGVFPLLLELFNRAADLQTASSDDVLGIELVKIIMLTIPYTLASGASVRQQAAELLNKTDIIASAPHDLEEAINPHVSIDATDIPMSQSVLGLLQNQLQLEAENDWKLDIIPKLFKPSEGLEDSAKHAFPELILPQTINSGSRALFPEVYFSLYADQDVETVPPTTNLAASLLRDSLVDTINLLDFNRSVSAKFLIDMDCYWTPGTFVKRATPFDKVKDAAVGTSTWKPEDLAVDAIFSQMLQLPTPEHKLVYYHSMVTETCKLAAGSIAPSLGRAIRYLYKNLEVMDLELSYRVLDWFAHHLSNFDFRWKWVEWLDDVDFSDLHPRKAFIVGVIDKEIRLSFAKRVRDTLPDAYHPLIPSSKDNDIPEFKYNKETHAYSSEAKKIVALLKRKAPETEIQSLIDTIHGEDAANGSTEPLLACIDAYVTALCYIGSKSLSHALSYIERGKERLIAFGPASPGARAQIIGSVIGYWRDVQPGVAVNIVDKLLNYSILTPASVVEWALATERLDGGRILAITWIYEIVERTIAKVTGRVRQIVAARMQEGLGNEQAAVLEKALREEAQAMRDLFIFIDDALAGVAGGAEETMLEEDLDEGDMKALRLWGVKWRRVFARKLAVEDMVIRESVKIFPAPAEESMAVDGTEVKGFADTADHDGEANGHVTAAVANGSTEGGQDNTDEIQ